MASSRGAAARNGSVPSVVTCSSPRVRSAKAAARASTSAPDSSTRRRAVRRLASWARSWRLAGSRRPVQARRASHAPCTGAARTATVTTTPTGSRSFRARGRTQAAAAIPAAPRGAAGIAAAAWVVPGALNDLLPVGVVVTVAVLAAPVQGAWLARRAWTGRREPANRQDRAQLAKRRTARRLVLESGALVLALAAAFALRTRGLLQVTTEGTDPFLAAAPLLLAIAITVLLLRVYPWPIRVVGVLGRRTRGVLGLLGAVRAQRAVAVLPLLALTLGAAVAVAGGLLVDTVRTGQVEASWERVGADIRVDAELTRDQVAAIAEQPGVTAVGSAHVARSVSFDAGTGSTLVTLVAVDRQYVDLLAATPFTSEVDVASLAALADTPAVDGKIPVVTGATLARRVGGSAAMYFGPEYVRVALAGATDYAPIGFFDGPFVFADLDTLSARMPDGLNATSN